MWCCVTLTALPSSEILDVCTPIKKRVERKNTVIYGFVYSLSYLLLWRTQNSPLGTLPTHTHTHRQCVPPFMHMYTFCTVQTHIHTSTHTHNNNPRTYIKRPVAGPSLSSLLTSLISLDFGNFPLISSATPLAPPSSLPACAILPTQHEARTNAAPASTQRNCTKSVNQPQA